jgi:DNA-binding response OmpR family regulator
VKNLRRKIEDDPGSPRIILTVLGGGYRLGLTRDE